MGMYYSDSRGADGRGLDDVTSRIDSSARTAVHMNGHVAGSHVYGSGAGASSFVGDSGGSSAPNAKKDSLKSVEDCLPDSGDLLDDNDLLGFCLPDSIDDVPADSALAMGLSLNASAPVFVPRSTTRPSPAQVDQMQQQQQQQPLDLGAHRNAFMAANNSPIMIRQQDQHRQASPQQFHGSPPPFGQRNPYQVDGSVGADKQHDDATQHEFNEALALLQANAPGYDIDSLISIFAANDYDVALTLDVIAHLEIEGGEDHTKEVASQPAPVLNDLNFPSLSSSAQPTTPPPGNKSKNNSKNSASKSAAEGRSDQSPDQRSGSASPQFDRDASSPVVQTLVTDD